MSRAGYGNHQTAKGSAEGATSPSHGPAQPSEEMHVNKPTDTTAPAGAPARLRTIKIALQDLASNLAKAHAVIALASDMAHEASTVDSRDEDAFLTLPKRLGNHLLFALDQGDDMLTALRDDLEAIEQAARAADRAGGL